MFNIAFCRLPPRIELEGHHPVAITLPLLGLHRPLCHEIHAMSPAFWTHYSESCMGSHVLAAYDDGVPHFETYL